MSKIDHISLPWQVKHDFDIEGLTTIIGNVDGEIVEGSTHYSYDFVCTTVDPDESVQSRSVCVANAEFIVRACNSYQSLIEALIWAEAAIAPFSKDPQPGSGINKVRAVIAKATGAA